MDLLALLLVLLPLAARCVSMDGASVVGDDLVGHGQQRKQQYSLPPPLLLTPLLEAGNATEARRLATVPPLLPSCCVSFSGFLTVDKQHDSNLFFWFFRPETRRGDAPLVVWLQGGPGTSMARTVFLENGPYQIDPRTMQLKRRRGSWTHEHSVLYFDNPVGTGFSFTGSPDGLATNCTQISWSLAEALRQFFIMFPGQRRRDLYIAGESFGGKMAVSLAHHLLFDKLNSFNLKGLLVVNGLVDAASQLDKSELAYQLGLVDEAGRDEMHAVAEEQARLMREGHWDQARELGVDECGSSVSPDVTGMAALSNLLLWNGTQDDGYHDFVQHLHIRRALHVGNATFSGRARAVAYALRDDVGQPVLAELGRVADRVRVLVASGQLDICLPYRLTANFLRKMVWQGAGEWDTARRVTWCVRGSLAGYARTSRGLTHVLVRNAGHYLGQDQPRWAADMLGRFTGQLSFDTCEERCDVRILT